MNLREELADFLFTEKRGRMIELSVSLVSQLFHFVTFGLQKPRIQFEKAMLIISIDVDVGSRKLGQINQGRNDANVNRCLSEYHVGEIEERALVLFVDLFNAFKFPATFAIRGQIIETDDSILGLLLKSPTKHEIGAHGYYHRRFKNLSEQQAEKELDLISIGMKKFGITPKSFVFPGNSVSHLRLLKKFGYECYRKEGSLVSDAMYIERKDGLYNVHPSLYLNQIMSAIVLKRILDIAILKRAPLHFWFHPWNFGDTNELIRKNIEDAFIPFLEYAKSKEQEGVLTFETMLSAARKAEKVLAANKLSLRNNSSQTSPV